MRTVVGTITVLEVAKELKTDLMQTKICIKRLVDSKGLCEHDQDDINDYIDLRTKEENLLSQIKNLIL